MKYDMSKEYINPKSLFDSTQYGFSQVVISSAGKFVFVAGQVAWNENQEIIGGGDLRVQAKQAFKNIETAIKAAGGNLKDIVMLRIYIVDYTSEKAEPVGDALREYFGTLTPPASTWLGVQALANEQFLIEIEAQAIIN